MSHTDTDHTGSNQMDNVEPKGYALNGKIMLIAIVILFFVIIIMVCLHIYARWYLLRARRRRNRRPLRTPLVFYVDPAAPTAVTMVSRGLDASVITSLPVFAYSLKTHPDPVECAVCLSEFEEGETGRVLPKCNHTFHIDCIDMWFQSHSTCPLCRAPVEPAPEVVLTVSEPGSSFGLSTECHHGGEEQNRTGPAVSSSSSSLSSIGFVRKPSSLVGVTVEVPGRSENLGDESSCDSPSTQSSFRSPMSRMLSLKRILSRERKAGSVSPSSGCVVGCSSSSMVELDETRLSE